MDPIGVHVVGLVMAPLGVPVVDLVMAPLGVPEVGKLVLQLDPQPLLDLLELFLLLLGDCPNPIWPEHHQPCR